jgi:hypothetical protein
MRGGTQDDIEAAEKKLQRKSCYHGTSGSVKLSSLLYQITRTLTWPDSNHGIFEESTRALWEGGRTHYSRYSWQVSNNRADLNSIFSTWLAFVVMSLGDTPFALETALLISCVLGRRWFSPLFLFLGER